MAMQSDEEFIEGLEELHYAAAFPWEKWYINYTRKKAGKAPLRDRDP